MPYSSIVCHILPLHVSPPDASVIFPSPLRAGVEFLQDVVMCDRVGPRRWRHRSGDAAVYSQPQNLSLQTKHKHEVHPAFSRGVGRIGVALHSTLSLSSRSVFLNRDVPAVSNA